MRYLQHLLFFIYIICISCGTGFTEPESPIEAGREFINAVYNGNFKKANKLIIDNEENKQLLKEVFEKDFRKRGGFEKEALSKASIQIVAIQTDKEGNTSIKFNNAYFSTQSQLWVEDADNLWRVNLIKSQIKP